LLAGSNDRLGEFVRDYHSYFTGHRRPNAHTAHNYLEGLLACEKGQANMERMEEEVEGSEYRRYQHFLSHSPWDHTPVLQKVAHDTSAIFEEQRERQGTPTGYLIDESAHVKKGTASVGVSRQYAGVVGKVENCQVGVYASLCNDTSATLINERLFLPACWADDPERCEEAGIPEEAWAHCSKPQQALAMIDENRAQGIQWDWIGGDGLYGHSYEFTKGLDERELFYVLDVHKDELIYPEEPQIAVPPRTHTRGATPKKLKADRAPMRLDRYCEALTEEAWEIVTIRKSTKGWLRRKVHVATVWVWDGEEAQACCRTLVITKTLSRTPKTKYSVSNGAQGPYTPKEYAYFQAQRYWVERCFDDAKNELGLSDYQVRKWQGWHHHHALVFMACLFLLKEKLFHASEAPLLSVRDARVLIVARLFGTDDEVERRLKQMERRHQKRKQDIERHYRQHDD
jgi:SRSO17 transposase